MTEFTLTQEHQDLVERFGVLHDRLGFSPAPGRVVGLLLVSPRPALTFDEIRSALGLSKSSTSAALNLLLGIGSIEYETRPAEVDSMIQLSVPDDLEERLEEQKASAPAPPPVQEPEAPAEVSYSREDLQSMDLASLRDVAESLGVPNAHSIPYKTSLINKIVKLAV